MACPRGERTKILRAVRDGEEGTVRVAQIPGDNGGKWVTARHERDAPGAGRARSSVPGLGKGIRARVVMRLFYLFC